MGLVCRCLLSLTAAYGQLGDTAAARKAVRELLRVRPDFTAYGRAAVEKWWDSGFVAQLTEGWRKAWPEMEPVNATITSQFIWPPPYPSE